MSAKHRCHQDGPQEKPYPVNPLTPARVGRSRPTLLASASLIALATLGEPGSAWAGCSGADRTISSSPFPGPILATGGDITVDAGASVAGGPTGVYAQDCGIGVLSNSGAIDGGAGALGVPGGVGVRADLDQTINSLSNAAGATISGGDGGSGPSNAAGGAGGVGVSNFGTVTTLSNGGAIRGGAGGTGGNVQGSSPPGAGGAGGAGLSNASTIMMLTNSGAISGGNGGAGGTGGDVQGQQPPQRGRGGWRGRVERRHDRHTDQQRRDQRRKRRKRRDGG